MNGNFTAKLLKKGQISVAVLAALIVFLLPLKFGTLAVMPEAASFFPEYIFSWLIINYPAHSFGLVSGILLILALLFFPIPQCRSGAGLIALFWGVLLPVATLPGWLNAVDPNYPLAQTAHWCGVGAFVLAIFLIISAEKRYARWLWGAVVAGTIYLGCDAWHQYFFGFAEMREFLQEQLANGMAVSEAMKCKIADNRVYATFVSCNALAGFLLLTIPGVVYAMQKLGQRFEPVRLSRWLFGLFSAGLLLTALLMTKSRGAFLVALLCGGAAGMSRLKRTKLRLILLLTVVLVILGGGIYIKLAGRGFLSMSERVDYLRSSAQMCWNKPLCGYGWGGFFRWHMLHKTTDSNETARDPHNLVATFATQSGWASGIIALGALLVPLFLLWRRRKNSVLAEAWFWGFLAFALHSLMEINSAIPGSLAAAGVVALLAAAPEKSESASLPLQVFLKGGAVILLAAALSLNFLVLRNEIALDNLTSELKKNSADPSPVLQALDKFQKYTPYAPLGRELVGDWLLFRGELSAARTFYLKALQLDHQRPSIWRRLGDWELKNGNLSEAEKCYQRAHELFPTNKDYDFKTVRQRFEKSGAMVVQ